MSTPRKQKKKAIKPARRDSRASTDAAVTPSIFGGSLLSLESRIMFDGAAVATASIVNTEQIAQNQAEDSSSADDAAATNAPTGEPSATADQALFDALAALDVSAARQDTLFVSTSVLDYQQLLDGISPNVEAQMLDPDRNGVEQMGDISSNYASIDPVNLIGDSTEAWMHLSSSFLTQHSISTSYVEQFQQIGQSLSADAELLIDGSSFGQGEAGQLAIDTLANLTGADVAASKDRTGHTTESADWLLEVTTGSIETSNVTRETTGWSGAEQGNLIAGTIGAQTDNRDNRTIHGNLIGTDAFSTGVASNAFEVQILGNAIYSNTGLGIDVEGVSSATANDAPAAADSTIDVISGALAHAPVEIVFVDTSVENYQALINGINNPDARVVLLDASRDGMEQIVAALGQVGRVDAIHLISHGNEGELKLGSTVLTGNNMQGEYADDLAVIKDHLTDEADILVYGCSFGKGEAGAAAAEMLGRLTGADVAASTDATGHAELGGDWDFELQQGSIETNLVVDKDAQDNWSGLLGVVDWDTQTWTAGITTPAVQNLTLADGSAVTVTLTQNAAGTLTSAATSATYTGGLVPAQSALQLGMVINPTTDTITVRVDFSSQSGGSVNNVSMTLFDIDNDEFAVFGSNLGNPTSATVGTTNTFNGTNRVSGNGIDANQATGAGNTTVKFNQTGITWVEFTYGSTSNATPIVILHDVLFNSIADVNGPKLDLNDNDAAVSASDNFDDSAPFTAAYNNPSGGSVPWASNWIEVDGAGAAQSATAGEVQVVDVAAGAAVDGEVRINRDTGAASSIQRQIDLTNYVNPTLSFNYRTTAGVDAADGIVVEASRDGGVTYTTLSTFTGTAGVISGTQNLSLAGYESANTIIRFRVSAGYTDTAANESFFVDNVTVGAEPTGFSSSYTEGGAGAAISDTDVVITDANSANMSGGKVSIITNFTTGDTLSFTNVGGVSGSYNSGTGVLTITGTGTIAQYQAFIAGVRYSSSSDDPTVGGTRTTRIISTSVQDQTTLNPSNMVFSTVAITAVNDAPGVDLNAGGAGQDVTTAFTEQTAVLIAPVGTLTDVDSATLSSLTVTLTTRPDGNAVESLSLNAAATTAASGAGLTVSYTAGTGVLSITGSATTAVYQSILQGILYNDTSNTPTTSNRTINVVANDGATPSATQTVTLTVAAVNDVPNIVDATVALNENSANGSAVTNVSDSFTGTDLDRDGQAITYSITGGNTGGAFTINSATGAITVANSAALDYETTPSFTLTVQASDGSLSDTAAITVNVTNVNEAPVLGGDATVSVAENTTGVGTFAAVDPDAGDTVTYSLSGADAALFSINAGTGAVSFLAAPNFESAPGPFAITVTATDAGSLLDTQNITVNVTNVNEAPVAGDDTATTPENTAVTTGNVLANDSDTDSMLSPASITAFDVVSVNGGMVVNNGDGTFTYTPAVSFTGTDMFTYTVSDGVLTDTATVTITVTPAVNSAPTLMTNAGAIVLAGFSDPITSDQLQVMDADNTPAQLVYMVTTGPMNGRLELPAGPGVAVTSFTQADINAGLLRYVHNGSANTGDSFTFTVSDGAGGTIGATTFNLTVMPFFPPPLGWPPAPGPASVPFTDLPGPPPVGIQMPASPPSPELVWSPGRQNPDVVQAKIVDKHDEPAPREKIVSKTFTSVEHVEPEDIVPQEPSDLPSDSLSPLIKKVLAMGHNFEERLTKEADILEQAIEERVIVTALSAGFMVWLLRRGSSLTSSFTSMLGRRKDDEQGKG